MKKLNLIADKYGALKIVSEDGKNWYVSPQTVVDIVSANPKILPAIITNLSGITIWRDAGKVGSPWQVQKTEKISALKTAKILSEGVTGEQLSSGDIRDIYQVILERVCRREEMKDSESKGIQCEEPVKIIDRNDQRLSLVEDKVGEIASYVREIKDENKQSLERLRGEVSLRSSDLRNLLRLNQDLLNLLGDIKKTIRDHNTFMPYMKVMNEKSVHELKEAKGSINNVLGSLEKLRKHSVENTISFNTMLDIQRDGIATIIENTTKKPSLWVRLKRLFTKN